jgi:hypothetical protein
LSFIVIGQISVNNCLFASKTLLEEMDIDCPYQIKSVQPKLTFTNGYFPSEIAISIFEKSPFSYPSSLKIASALNREWNSWARSKLLPYRKLYKAAEEVYFSKNKDEDKSIFKNVALHFLFNPTQKLKRAPQQTLKIHKTFREIIANTVEENIFSFYKKERFTYTEDTYIVKDNPKILCVPSYENKDKIYSPIKLLKAWTELQRYKSGTYISHMLWEARDYFHTVLSRDLEEEQSFFREWNTRSYNSERVFTNLDNINYYNTYNYENIFDYKDEYENSWFNIRDNQNPSTSLSELFHTARKHWKDYPDSKYFLFKIISQIIDLDKHILVYIDEKDTEENMNGAKYFYENCPDYKLLTLFQGTPIDFDSIEIKEAYYKRMREDFAKYKLESQEKNPEEKDSEEKEPYPIRNPNKDDMLSEKLNLLNESILRFAQHHIIPAEIYTRIVQGQLKLG